MKSMFNDHQATLVDLVAFKWMMAGRGWRVDLSRLQRDLSYAQECGRRARSSGVRELELHAVTLLGLGSSASAEQSGQLPHAIQ
jgi:hypothetical protein